MTTATIGTGTITLGSAVTLNGVTYLTFSQAGVQNGDVVSYAIADQNASEVGTGTYTSSTGTLTRNVTKSTNGNSAINLSGTAQVFITPRAEDIPNSIAVQKFTGSGTYTPNAGLLYAIIECVGGGAGGGGTPAAGASVVLPSGGGGAGSYSRAYVSAAIVGASQTVTIGAKGTGATGDANGNAGGDTSVGTLCSAKGGSGGKGNSNGSTGGAGGIAGTGDIAATGASGVTGYLQSGAFAGGMSGGAGASSPFGGGGISPFVNGAAGNGGAATGFGAGGSGGVAANNSAGVAANGGDGSAGLVIITEFIRQ